MTSFRNALACLILFLHAGMASAVTVQDMRPGSGQTPQISGSATFPDKSPTGPSKNEKEAARDELARLKIIPAPEEQKVFAYILFVAGPVVLLIVVLSICRKA